MAINVRAFGSFLLDVELLLEGEEGEGGEGEEEDGGKAGVV